MRARSWILPSTILGVAALSWGGGCVDDGSTSTTSTSTSTSTSSSESASSSSSSGTGGVGGVGGTGGVGGVGGQTIANDTCGTAEPVDLSDGDSKVVKGTTIGSKDDYVLKCGDPSGSPDVVYQLNVKQGGYLTVAIDDHVSGMQAFDSAISLRLTMCDPRQPDDFCATQKFIGDDVTAGTYFVIVEGQKAAVGDFSLTFNLAAPTCGDSLLNNKSGTEQCDDGMAGSMTCYGPNDVKPCQFKPPPVTNHDDCPGEDILGVDANATVWVGPYDNTLFMNKHDGTCTVANPGGVDNTFHFVPNATGMVTVVVGLDHANGDVAFCAENGCDLGTGMNCLPGCWVTALYSRSGSCADNSGGTELGCVADFNAVNLVQTLTFPVTKGQDYWVYVDGISAPGPFNSGPYYLKVTLQ